MYKNYIIWTAFWDKKPIFSRLQYKKIMIQEFSYSAEIIQCTFHSLHKLKLTLCGQHRTQPFALHKKKENCLQINDVFSVGWISIELIISTKTENLVFWNWCFWEKRYTKSWQETHLLSCSCSLIHVYFKQTFAYRKKY